MYPAVPDRHLPSITPLTARSVALSTLLGYHPPALPISALVKVGELLGIADRATRVALTRMVKDGDVTVDNERVPPVGAVAATAGPTGCARLAPHSAVDGGVGDGHRHEHDPARWPSGWHCVRAWCGIGWASCARGCGCGPTTSLASSTGSSPTSVSFSSVTTLTRRVWQRRSGTCRDGRLRRTDC